MQDPSFYETMCLVSKWQGVTRTESSRRIFNQHMAEVHGVNAVYRATREPNSRFVPPFPASHGRNPVSYTHLTLPTKA